MDNGNNCTVGLLKHFVLSFALAAPLVLFPAEGARAEPARIVFEPYVYEAHDGRQVQAELGRFEVAKNRASDEPGRMTLAFVRLPASGDEKNPPIVYLAGGPGGSGIEAGRGSRFDLFERLRRHADVILLDQRGTGLSDGPDPEECPIEREYPLDRIVELQPYLEMVEAVGAECRRYWERHGVDLDAYDTLESAQDIEAMRSALGSPRLSLLGISYGTHLALAYMRQYPEHLHRAVLAGVEGPDHTVKLPIQFDRQLDKLDDLVAEQEVLNWEEGDTRKLVARILGQVREAPVRLRITEVEGPDRTEEFVVGPRELAQITMDMLQDPQSMIQVPNLYQQLDIGDYTGIAPVLRNLRSYGTLDAMPEATDAASGISDERRQRIVEQDEELLLGAGLLLENQAVARGLGVPDLGQAFRSQVQSSVPTLFISGTLDGRTPRANAMEVARGFDNARHLTIVNGGHSDDLLVTSPELPGAIAGFFEGGEPPAELHMPSPDLSTARNRMPLSPEDARRYTGEYERESGAIWRVLHHNTVESLDANGEVRFSNAVLQIRWGGNGFPFHPVSETEFFIDFPWFLDANFYFELGESGNVEALVFENSEGETVRMKKVH